MGPACAALISLHRLHTAPCCSQPPTSSRFPPLQPSHRLHPLPPPQLGVAAYLAFGLNEPIYGAVLLGLILPQARTAWPWLYAAGSLWWHGPQQQQQQQQQPSSCMQGLLGAARGSLCCLPASAPCCDLLQIYAQVKYFLPDPVQLSLLNPLSIAPIGSADLRPGQVLPARPRGQRRQVPGLGAGAY